MREIEDTHGAALEFLMPCEDLDVALGFFLDKLGFRLEMIFPADAPRVAVVSGSGVNIRLDAGEKPGSGRFRLLRADSGRIARLPPTLLSTLGRCLEIAADTAAGVPGDHPPVALPRPQAALVVHKRPRRGGEMGDAGEEWGAGRAGMHYRDLIPGRLGGGLIASHIRIPVGGPVPDYVHHHHVRFQMIYCYRGWVRLVYEDQGPPFVMRAGDCVLQPPHIRHRVLECSDAFEVIEVGCPADHETLVDHDLLLPTAELNPDRDFSGQRFLFHRVREARWRRRSRDGFDLRDTGIAAATNGLASVVVARPSTEALFARQSHDAGFLFHFILEGTLELHTDLRGADELASGDAFVIPDGTEYALAQPSTDLELLEIALPGQYSVAGNVR